MSGSPLDELSCVASHGFERAEADREAGTVLHRLELGLGEGVVVARSGPRVISGDAEVPEALRYGLGGHRGCAAAGEGMASLAWLRPGKYVGFLLQLDVGGRRDPRGATGEAREAMSVFNDVYCSPTWDGAALSQPPTSVREPLPSDPPEPLLEQLEQGRDPMWIYAVESGRLLAVNEAMVVRYHHTRAQALALTFEALHLEEELPRLRELLALPALPLRITGVWQHQTREGRSFRVEAAESALIFAGQPARLVVAVDVTEREQLRRSVEASEEVVKSALDFYKQVLDCVPVPTWRRDEEGTLIFSNVAFQDFWGESGSMEAEVYDQSIHPDDRPVADERWLAARAARTPFEAEVRIRNLDGEYRWCHSEARPLWDTEGVFLGHVGARMDIHARRAAEDAARISEALARTAFNASPDVMIMADLETGRYVAVNDAFVRVSGFPREEVLGKTPQELGLWGNDTPLALIVDRVSRGEPVEAVEVPLQRRDGQEFLASISAARVTYRGRLCIIATLRDVTSLRQLESERLRLLAALDQMAEALIVTDAAGLITHVNPAFERMSGWPRAEVLGRSPDLLESGKHDEGFYAAMWATIRGGGTFRGAMVNRRKDGSEYCADAVISPVWDAEGVITHYVAVQRDVTEEHSLQAQLLHSQKMDLVGRLVSGVAHDFNTILTAIGASAHFLLEDLEVGDPRRGDAEIVAESAERAAGLTRQLLAFSRKEVIAPRTLDLNALVKNLAKMLGRLLREDVRLTVKTASTPAPLRADAGQLEQVVMNLVVNAREALGGSGSIEVRTRVEGRGDSPAGSGQVVLEVADTGMGMDEQTRERIFEPFFTTKERGTGLGLATVAAIVHGLGGTIGVESELGRGSCFRIRLPLVAEDTVAATAGNGSLTAPWRARVLVVEDDAAVRALMTRALELNGYEAFSAGGVDDALARVRGAGGALDVLVADLILPDGSGYALARTLTAGQPALRTVLVSGYGSDAESVRVLRAAGGAYLQKPFTPPEMLAVLRELLGQPRAPRP